MKINEKKDSAPITTLAALNTHLQKALQSKIRLTAEEIDDGATATQVDQAVALSPLVVTNKVTKGALESEIRNKIEDGKVKKVAKDPLQIRKEAAKKCPTFDGQYYGGDAKTLHVHDIGGNLHVKVGADDRKNIYVNGKLRKDVLAECRRIIKDHPLGLMLNTAIDKGLLAYGLDLDTY